MCHNAQYKELQITPVTAICDRSNFQNESLIHPFIVIYYFCCNRCASAGSLCMRCNSLVTICFTSDLMRL